MHRTRSMKRKTRNRLILIRNLKKGQARKEPRCDYQLIPYPSKFLSPARLYRLYADLVLLEKDDTLVSGATLYNNFKIYKNAQMCESVNQKIVKIKIENKDIPVMDWRGVTEKLGRSDSAELKNWTKVIREYCERYETVVKKMQKDQEEIANSKQLQVQWVDRNKKLEQFRENILKTYPYAESKLQLVDGQMQITEMSFSEKYLAELGYTTEEFTTTVFQEGVPEILSLSSQAGTFLAKLRLEKYMMPDQDGYQTPDFESHLVTKNGPLKKIKYRVYYYTCFEKGVPGFVLIGAIVGKEKPLIKNTTNQPVKINSEFVDYMCRREKERDNFLASYYDQRAEKKYLDTYKTCKVKEIDVIEKIEG